MSCVCRVWTKNDDVLAVVASSSSLSTEWFQGGADKWHDFCILDANLKAEEIISLMDYSEADGVSVEGHSIEIISVNEIT